MDLETNGLNPLIDSTVCIGIAWSHGSVCIDTREDWVETFVMNWLDSDKWYAFNTQFDASFVWNKLQRQPNIAGCALIMFKLMATEGWVGQRHNLSTAIETILNWPDNTKDIIPELLEEQGLGKNEMSTLMDTHTELFMKYCAQDADAAFQVMTVLRKQARDRGFGEVIRQHDTIWTNHILCHIEQKLRGMLIDVPRLSSYSDKLRQEIEQLTLKFMAHPDVHEHISSYNKEVYDEHTAPIKTTKKIWAKKSDTPVGLSWEDAGYTRGEKKNPAKWEVEANGPWFRTVVKLKQRRRSKPPKLFNVGSAKDLRWLYYSCGVATYRVIREPDPTNEKPWLRSGQVEYKVNTPEGVRIAEWDMTKGGQLAVDKDVLTFFGESGKILKERNKKQTQLQYNESMLGSVNDVNVLHPDVRVFATVTGRSAGKSL